MIALAMVGISIISRKHLVEKKGQIHRYVHSERDRFDLQQ